MRFGSLFAGIGGMDLGLERAGMQCAWQVEIDPFCRKVLTKHWPDVPKFNDVKECGKHNLEQVDLIAGGFPCQDISDAGKRAGIDGSRSGLWREFHRIICELRPRYVLVENVAALLVRGMGRVLGDLAQSGYDAEWRVLPAGEFLAPHRRERVFVIAYPYQVRRVPVSFSAIELHQIETPCLWQSFGTVEHDIWLTHYCGLSGNDNGIPRRLDAPRIAAIGNAVVPQVAEWIGRRILEADKQ